jgi:hypothetical protein
VEVLRMIVQAQNIKPGMVIFLPNVKELFTVREISILFHPLYEKDCYEFSNYEGEFVGALEGFPIPVVGFTND